MWKSAEHNKQRIAPIKNVPKITFSWNWISILGLVKKYMAIAAKDIAPNNVKFKFII